MKLYTHDEIEAMVERQRALQEAVSSGKVLLHPKMRRAADPEAMRQYKIEQALQRQQQAARPLLVGVQPLLAQEWDDEAGQYVETISPGPLTRHFSHGDPGDEI